MLIWMPEAENYVCSKLESGKEAEAKAVSSAGWAYGVADGFLPHSSADIDKPYFIWWNKNSKDNWVEYRFKEPVSLSSSQVYWLNVDHYDGNYRVPESWSLQYKTPNGKWAPVITGDHYGLELDKYNTVTFKPVMTSALRMNVEFQPDNSCGILEWKVD